MIIDIIVIVILMISAFIAFLRGFIRETLTIAGVVGGLAAAYFGGPMLIPFMRGWMGVTENTEKPEMFYDLVPLSLVADVISYGLVFFVVVIVLSILSHVLAESARGVGLGAVDRTLGVLFGLARGAVLIALLYLPFSFAMDAEAKKTWFKDSRSYIYLEKSSAVLLHFLPEGTRDKFDPKNQKPGETLPLPIDRKSAIDLLKQQMPTAATPAVPPAEQKGHTPDTRENMQQLIEQNTQTPPPQEAAP